MQTKRSEWLLCEKRSAEASLHMSMQHLEMKENCLKDMQKRLKLSKNAQSDVIDAAAGIIYKEYSKLQQEHCDMINECDFEKSENKKLRMKLSQVEAQMDVFKDHLGDKRKKTKKYAT